MYKVGQRRRDFDKVVIDKLVEDYYDFIKALTVTKDTMPTRVFDRQLDGTVIFIAFLSCILQ